MGDRQYTETHEWVAIEGDVAVVGITDYAQAQLGDVVFLELPSVGRDLQAGQAFGVIESVKSASDLYSPIAGTVAAVNERLAAEPEVVNRDPYGEGWLMRVRMSGSAPERLLSEPEYAELTQGSSR